MKFLQQCIVSSLTFLSSPSMGMTIPSSSSTKYSNFWYTSNRDDQHYNNPNNNYGGVPYDPNLDIDGPLPPSAYRYLGDGGENTNDDDNDGKDESRKKSCIISAGISFDSLLDETNNDYDSIESKINGMINLIDCGINTFRINHPTSKKYNNWNDDKNQEQRQTIQKDVESRLYHELISSIPSSVRRSCLLSTDLYIPTSFFSSPSSSSSNGNDNGIIFSGVKGEDIYDTTRRKVHESLSRILYGEGSRGGGSLLSDDASLDEVNVVNPNNNNIEQNQQQKSLKSSFSSISKISTSIYQTAEIVSSLYDMRIDGIVRSITLSGFNSRELYQLEQLLGGNNHNSQDISNNGRCKYFDATDVQWNLLDGCKTNNDYNIHYDDEEEREEDQQTLLSSLSSSSSSSSPSSSSLSSILVNDPFADGLFTNIETLFKIMNDPSGPFSRNARRERKQWARNNNSGKVPPPFPIGTEAVLEWALRTNRILSSSTSTTRNIDDDITERNIKAVSIREEAWEIFRNDIILCMKDVSNKSLFNSNVDMGILAMHWGMRMARNDDVNFSENAENNVAIPNTKDYTKSSGGIIIPASTKPNGLKKSSGGVIVPTSLNFNDSGGSNSYDNKGGYDRAPQEWRDAFKFRLDENDMKHLGGICIPRRGDEYQYDGRDRRRRRRRR